MRAQTASCPYTGLWPFTADDRHYFFRRASDAKRIAQSISSEGLTVLYGPSGVGKSSVLGAALPQALQEAFHSPLLVLSVNRWDRGFYAKLVEDSRAAGAKAYREWGRTFYNEQKLEEKYRLQEASADEQSDSIELAERRRSRIRKLPSLRSMERLGQVWIDRVDTPVVFLLDQFEQYLNQRSSETLEFEIDVARIVNRRDLGAHVLISIREDKYNELNQLRARIPHILNHSLKLDYLDKKSAREAIEGPLRVWHGEHGPNAGPTSAAPELVDTLIQQVSQTEDATRIRTEDTTRIETAFLQLALKRLWEEERRQGSTTLRLETLENLGGASGIVKRHFLDTMRALPEDEQRLCAAIFALMVPPSGMKIALSADDLAKLAYKETERVRNVLEKLANGPSRIINCVRSPKDNRTFLFEIFHDVLARPILDWIAAERERVQQQEKLERQRRAAEEERARQQAQLEQQRLEAEKEHARQQREIAWQQQQLARENHLKRRYRNLFIVAGLFFFLASVSAAVATYTYRDAAEQKSHVIAAKGEVALDDGDGRTGLLLALEALPKYPGPFDWLNYPDQKVALKALDRALWMPLGLGLSSPERRVTLGAFGPDGSIVTASDTGIVQLWRGEDIDRLRLAEAPESPLVLNHDGAVAVNSASLGPDGEVLVTTLADGHAYIWDVRTGKCHTDEIEPCRNQPGGHAYSYGFLQ